VVKSNADKKIASQQISAMENQPGVSEWLREYLGTISDPTLNENWLAAEGKYRPQRTELGLKDQENTLFGVNGQAGTLSMLERMMPQVAQMQAGALSSQRESDIADVERLGSRATAAMRASDPEMQRLLGQQGALTDQLYGTAQRMSPQEQRLAQQQARTASMSRGRGFDQSGIAGELMSRDEMMAQKQARAQQAGSQYFGMLKATGSDPFQAILGRPGTTWAGAQQQQMYGGGAADSLLNSGIYDMNAGINIGLQQQSNMLNYNAALTGARASENAGMMSGLGSLFGGAIQAYGAYKGGQG